MKHKHWAQFMNALFASILLVVSFVRPTLTIHLPPSLHPATASQPAEPGTPTQVTSRGARSSHPVTTPPQANLASTSNTPVSALPNTDTIVTFASDTARDSFLAKNRLQLGDITYKPTLNAYVVPASPDVLNTTDATASYPRLSYHATGYNDPLASSQWAISAASFDPSWSISKGTGVVVAVIDTGFALNHQDLAGSWWTNPNEQSLNASLDKDNDGYASDYRGWDFVHGDNNPGAGTDATTSSAFHGTMVAGIIAASAGNALGVSGLASGARIMPLQVLSDSGSGYTDDVASAVHYAADHGARVINLSLGGTTNDQLLHNEIDYAIGKGAIVVAAAGNDGAASLSYPAAYPEVVAVGAITKANTRASFSNYGSGLDIYAPGVGICSTFWSTSNQTSDYGCGDGTSFAAPIVSAALAQITSAYPATTTQTRIGYLLRGASFLATGSPPLLNAFQALLAGGTLAEKTGSTSPAGEIAAVTNPDTSQVISARYSGGYSP